MTGRMKSGKRDIEALGDPAPTTCYSLCRQSRVFFFQARFCTAKRQGQAMALDAITPNIS